MIGALLLLGLLLLGGCVTPRTQEAKFKDDYISYNESAFIYVNINNPGDTSFEGKVEIAAIISEGFFNCFESTNKNISTILPKKSYNEDIEIKSKNNSNCKGKDFNVYINLKDLNSEDVLGTTKLILHIRG